VSIDRVERIIGQRIAMLEQSNPELTTEWAIINDDWGLVSISQGEELIGFEYIESEISWARPERLKVYEETLNQGLSLVIIVPEEVYLEMRGRVAAVLGRRAPEVLSYDSIGITAMPRPS
jgi:hypothetical protein